LPRSFAAHVDVGVIGVADEPVTTPGKLSVELVQHDVGQQRRQRRALRHALVDADHNPIRQHDSRLQHPSDQDEQPPIADPLSEPGHQPLMADPIEELLQIEVDHPLVPVFQMPLGFVYCRGNSAQDGTRGCSG